MSLPRPPALATALALSGCVAGCVSGCVSGVEPGAADTDVPPGLPRVAVVATPSSGTAPLEVALTCAVDGGDGPVTVGWSHGDGTEAHGPTSTHAYARPGSHVARCTAVDADGDVASAAVHVEVAPPDRPPQAGILAAPAVGRAPLAVTFGATALGDGPLSVAWDFGDGGTSVAPQVPHSFTVPGDYAVSLRVVDGKGRFETDVVTVHVLPAEVKDAPPWAAVRAVGGGCALTGTPVQLDASASGDPEGKPLLYRWYVVSAPRGGTPTLSGETLASPTFVPKVDGTYLLRVVVSDRKHAVSSDLVRVDASRGRRVEIAAGDGQAAEPGSAFGAPVVARVTNACGLPVPGAGVAWVGDGVLPSPQRSVTDDQGLASTRLVAPADGGTFTLDAATRASPHVTVTDRATFTVRPTATAALPSASEPVAAGLR